MSFDWVEFYRQANGLAQNRHPNPGTPITLEDEAALRSAISRAYYATYHRAKILLDEIGDTTPPGTTGGAHERFIARFTNNGAARIKALGPDLDRLKKARHIADYADVIWTNNMSILQQTRKALRKSKDLINDFERLKTPPGSRIIP